MLITQIQCSRNMPLVVSSERKITSNNYTYVPDFTIDIDKNLWIKQKSCYNFSFQKQLVHTKCLTAQLFIPPNFVRLAFPKSSVDNSNPSSSKKASRILNQVFALRRKAISEFSKRVWQWLDLHFFAVAPF